MSWSYSGNPKASNKDAVRHILSLTDSNNQLKQDEEIEWELSQEGDSVEDAAANIAESLAAMFAQRAKRESGPIQVDYQDISERYMNIANRLRSRDSSSVGRRPVAEDSGRKKNQRDRSDRVSPFFTRDMHENN